jgi:hypothetical protein
MLKLTVVFQYFYLSSSSVTNFYNIRSKKCFFKLSYEINFSIIIEDFSTNVKDRTSGLRKINRKLTVLNNFLQKNFSGPAIFTRPE